MSSKDEAYSTRVIIGGVHTDQTSSCCNNNKLQETIISVRDTDLNLSAGDLKNLSLLDEALEGDQTAKPLIQRVPSMLGQNKHFMKYFKPKTIAIGPLHHGDPGLQGAEKLKLKLAAYFIKKHGLEKEILYTKIKIEIEKLKKCYDPSALGEYGADDEKLTWMFFLDGCAVLQAIYLRYAPKTDHHVEEDTSNKLNVKNDLLTFVYIDLFLLENQLPYRVLELLTSSSEEHRNKFEESIQGFIDDYVMTPAEKMKEQQKQQQEKQQQQQQQKQGKQQKQQQIGEPVHLLERLRDRLLVTEKEKKSLCRSCGCNRFFRYSERVVSHHSRVTSHHSHTFRNVKELKEAGIWLKPSEISCLKDISFSRACCVGKLRLPAIAVDDSTGPKFMNLIAFEMCPDFNNDFAVTSYICFLDSLIDEAEDVKALRDAGILHNALGSDEEVAKIFNKMNTDLVPSPSIYYEVKTQIQNHCENNWIKYAAQAYHTHFTSPWTFLAPAQAYHTHFTRPWTFLAFVGAMAALFLSALQTYYTIHPKNQDPSTTPSRGG